MIPWLFVCVRNPLPSYGLNYHLFIHVLPLDSNVDLNLPHRTQIFPINRLDPYCKPERENDVWAGGGYLGLIAEIIKMFMPCQQINRFVNEVDEMRESDTHI